MASEIKVDTISEKTSANGVTIDGVNIKDSALATAGSVPLSTIDIDGGTDIGAAIVDADLFIIDDGAGGTNRKVAASRIKTYAGGTITALNNATANELVTIGSTTTELDAEANLTFSGSALQCTATLTVGVDDTGHDVKFFGATSGAYMLWDESTDDLVLAGAANLYLYDAGGGEKLSSDGTDLTINSGNDINLTATTDINIPSDVGLTFGDDGEKIEGDGTNLTIGAGGFGQLTIFPRNPAGSGSYSIATWGDSSISNNYKKYNFVCTDTQTIAHFQNKTSSSTPKGISILYSAVAPDTGGSEFIVCSDSSASRFEVESDGDCANHDNSFGSLSDERIKQNIRDANSQWDDIKALRVRNFKKKDDVRQHGENAWEQIGLIAQEVEAAGMDKLVKESQPTEADLLSDPSFGELIDDTDNPNDDGTFPQKIRVDQTVKHMKYSVLYMKAIKCLQEAQTRIETLEAKVTALEG
ncbi:tail fiber domain-containing protein [bacterium]|nr:tail fiber domain-containing protein [bacterium]